MNTLSLSRLKAANNRTLQLGEPGECRFRGIIMENSLVRNLAAAVVIALAVAVPGTAMADLITLALTGITGDVTVAGQQGTIEVLSLTGNVQTTVSQSGTGSGSRVSLPVFSDLVIHKRFDSSSPALFLALVKGVFLKSGVITFLDEKTNGGGFTKIFTITLSNVVLTKYETDDVEQEASAAQEQVILHYDKIQMTDEVTGQSACYDLTTARTC
jgi:type VI secretion system Hcp family effector